MKNLLYIISLCGLLTACDLQEEPYGFYSDDNFYKSETDAESGLLYAYNALTFLEYSRGIFYIGDIPTETMSPKSDEAGDVYQLENWIANRETEQLQYYFKYCYIGINRANTVIDRVSGGNLNETVKNRVVGEALFLRAWNYFNLVRAYGRVPLYTEPIASLDQTTPQMAASIDKIYERILEDLIAAEKMLTVNKVFGRIDKVGAQALLSKVYLTLASSIASEAPGYASAPHNPDEMYTQAAYWSRKVVFDYKETYNFDNDLRSIYDVTKPDGPEHIFIMGIDRSGTHEGMYSKIPLQFLPNNGSAPIYIRYSDGSLQKGNGNGWGVFLIEDNFVEKTFLATDKRRTELIHKDIYDQTGKLVTPSPVRGYFSAKYVDPDFIGERTSARPFLIRYSDIALVFAEAAGPDEGLALVNEIRRRAGIPDLPEGMSLSEFRKAVIQERTLELAFEGNRLYDLRRTASVTTTVPEATKLSEEQAAFYPIPQRELDLNPNVK
ncbi:MAG: RagB/SusD family nutrient uptake outer membrane protein [Alistipes onderdonkii]|nr:RagB/SusD family nutrient uptake outer membrane protein [Alistipes onderdonkii]